MADERITYSDNVDGLDMPYSLDAERAVLGSVLIRPECIALVISLIRVEHFYVPEHRHVYEAMLSLDANGQEMDPLVILERLKSDGVFDDAAGKSFMVELANAVPSAVNVKSYCEIVREKFLLRTLVTVSRDIVEKAVSGEDGADSILDSAEQRIYDIRKGKLTDGPTRLSDILTGEVLPNLSKLGSDDADELKGIPSGFYDLDSNITGFHKSDLIILGARPGMGKTSLALNMARNVSMAGHRVLFFSLEMSNEQLAQRVLSAEARVPSIHLRSGKILPDEWKELVKAYELLRACDLFFDDTSTLSVPEMKARVRRLGSVDCVFVDYLGLLQPSKSYESRVQEVSDISRGLKMMAKDLKIPIVACAQLSRAPEAKSGKASRKPVISDLRDSGSIEQDADIVLMLYREGYHANEKDDPADVDMNSAELDIGKNRHGPTCSVKLGWNSEFTMFTSYSGVSNAE